MRAMMAICWMNRHYRQYNPVFVFLSSPALDNVLTWPRTGSLAHQQRQVTENWRVCSSTKRKEAAAAARRRSCLRGDRHVGNENGSVSVVEWQPDSSGAKHFPSRVLCGLREGRRRRRPTTRAQSANAAPGRHPLAAAAAAPADESLSLFLPFDFANSTGTFFFPPRVCEQPSPVATQCIGVLDAFDLFTRSPCSLFYSERKVPFLPYLYRTRRLSSSPLCLSRWNWSDCTRLPSK